MNKALLSLLIFIITLLISSCISLSHPNYSAFNQVSEEKTINEEDEIRPDLFSVVDDPEWVEYLDGIWGVYLYKGGKQFDRYKLIFDKSDITFQNTHVYNIYEYVEDISVSQRTDYLKIIDNIIYHEHDFLYENIESIEKKFGRIEILSKIEFNLYPIISSSENEYIEDKPIKYTKAEFIELPFEEVIDNPDYTVLAQGIYEAESFGIVKSWEWDFSSGKNFFIQKAVKRNGASSQVKYEFKIIDQKFYYRKWNDDYDPTFKYYNIEMKSENKFRLGFINTYNSLEGMADEVFEKK